MTLGQFAKVTEDLKKPTTSLWVLSCQVLLDLSITGWFLAMSLHCMGFAAGVWPCFDPSALLWRWLGPKLMGDDPRVFSKIILLKAGRAGIKTYKIYIQSSIVFCFVRQSPRDVWCLCWNWQHRMKLKHVFCFFLSRLNWSSISKAYQRTAPRSWKLSIWLDTEQRNVHGALQGQAAA